MKFEQGNCYSHKHMRDVKIFVRSVDGDKLKVFWITWSGHMLAEDDFKVPENTEDWYLC